MVKVGAALGAGLLLAACREHFGEEIAEGRRMIGSAAGEIEPLKTAAAPVVGAERRAGIVVGAPLRIHQRFVRLEDLPEARFRRAVTRVDVRVIPPRETTVRALDVRLARVVFQPKDDVEIHLRFLLFLLVNDLRVDDVAL